MFFTLSLFPTLLCLVLGWQEHRKAPLLNVYCVLTRTHTQMHKTHPHWNKHNPPAPLSWVTLLKQNNNDRVQGGDLCVCVCPLMKNTQTRKLNWIPTLLITDCLGAGWRSELDQRRSSVYREEQLRSATSFSQILWQCISNVMLQLIKLVNMSYFRSSLSKNVSQIFLT